jgi:hypothetical protein
VSEFVYRAVSYADHDRELLSNMHRSPVCRCVVSYNDTDIALTMCRLLSTPVCCTPLQDIDWGSLDVFTCSASCDVLPSGGKGDGSAYVEELVLVQPPVYKDA